LQERGRGDGYGNGDPAGRRPAVLAVVQGDVARVVIEHLRSRRRARPGAVHVVRYLNLSGGVVLAEPPDQQISLGNRAGECDRGRRDPGSRERHSLYEGRGGRLGKGRAGKEGAQSRHQGKARVGRRQKLHGNSLLYKGMSQSSLELANFDRAPSGIFSARSTRGRGGRWEAALKAIAAPGPLAGPQVAPDAHRAGGGRPGRMS